MKQGSSKALGIIPARLESTRLPQKLLLAETGRPLLQHTWESAQKSKTLSKLIVATDSPEIAEAVKQFGGESYLTGDHPSGTDRIAEVIRSCDDDAGIVINIQGDEPEINPESIDRLVHLFDNATTAEMATLATPILDEQTLNDPSCTKVVCGADGRALYFSRGPIPFCRDGNVRELLSGKSPWLLHIGVYAYRRDFLLRLTELPPSKLEVIEKLEQLRALEAGATIQVEIVSEHAPGIDTPDNYANFVSRFNKTQG